MAAQPNFESEFENRSGLDPAPTKATLDQTQLSDLLKPVEADWSGIDEPQNSVLASVSGAHLGRYEIVRRIGQGGFGKVFLARDSELDRMVAIKLPHLERMKEEHLKQMYLQEAKTLAKLDHPAIVPIYDCGVIADGRCFVVSKYIQGSDLAKLLATGPLQLSEAVQLLIAITEALHFVHRSGFVHRDIKPANLLLGDDGRVYVADFGLAVRDETTAELTSVAGTPGYMSPEQIRREGHRIDGRSDQFSLGVVMYEMLTGARPFVGGSSKEVMELILRHEPSPPRVTNARVPAELNRICLKLLSKLASQRYAETIELVHDLRNWLKSAQLSSFEIEAATQALSVSDLTNSDQHSSTRLRQSLIVPRGLRSFTRADAYFYLDLLPDPRDRDGLPELVSRWKHWVEVDHADQDEPAFHRIGVVSGPTGCGKSSLVRAGLLPVLSTRNRSVMIEASADLTEKQLLAAVRRRGADATGENEQSLSETLAAIRRTGLPNGESLLIVIDQFEQWLNANNDLPNSELVLALRQCDGFRIQSILIVRDDFWLALTRFMAAVEVPLQVGRNAMMVDLFDLRHARKVLIEFGRGYQRLPLDSRLTRDQEKFVDGAIAHLTTDGSVIPVHLALFGEMVKNREWTSATLRQLGGAAGVGVQFLNESFSATYAPANQRTHELAARKVLRALLPPLGSEIKSSRRSRAELLAHSGYENDLAKFDALMVLLNSDLKLISAIDAFESSRSDPISGMHEESAFQLSHDFLVPSIREWLNSKQRESFRGRLHQHLTEQARLWNHQRIPRFLPNILEGALAKFFISSKTLTEVERAMLRARDRRTAALLLAMVACTLAAYWGAHRVQTTTRVKSLVEQLATADGGVLPKIVEELKPYDALARDALQLASASAPGDSHQRFVLQSATLHFDDRHLDEVFQGSLRHMTPKLVTLVSDALRPRAVELIPRYWLELDKLATAEALRRNSIADSERAFRALLILASLDPPADSASMPWAKHNKMIADLLESACSRHPDDYSYIAEAFRPALPVLLDPLVKDFSSPNDDGKNRYATALLASYTSPDSRLRTRLATTAVDWQRDVLFPKPDQWHQQQLWSIVQTPVNEAEHTEDQNRSGRQRATAAALLIARNDPETVQELLSLLRRVPNPTLRSHLINQCKQVGVTSTRLLELLNGEADPGIQCGLMLALGEYSTDEVSLPEFASGVGEVYRKADDPAVQATADWLLRKWRVSLPLATEVDTPTAGREENEVRRIVRRIKHPNGLNLVRIDATAISGILRSYWISDREISIKQFREFRSGEYFSTEFGPSEDCPANVIEWREAASFCNWLSQREGLPAFYPAMDEEAEQWIAGADELAATGYRLPTVSEWEFACRGGTNTPWHCGTDIELLKHYAGFLTDRTDRSSSLVDEDGNYQSVSHACGTLRPNDFGLFDMHGNVEEWCQDPGVFNSSERRVRGGASSFYPFTLKVDREASLPPRIQHNSVGFRVVRTIQ